MVEVVFGIIIRALIVERYLFARHMTRQLEKANLAVMSRNINDYLAATHEPKNNNDVSEDEDIDLGEADDREFMEAIRK